MNNNINIFETAKPQGGEFFAFNKVGDAIQGTYIDKRKGVDGFGNTQTIYVLIDKEGKVWNCGFRESSVTGSIIAARMQDAGFGTIVGFRFDRETPSKIKPGVMAKVINAYFDPKVVDLEWLAKRKEIESQYVQPDGVVMPNEVMGNNDWGPFSAPTDAGPVAGNLPTGEVAKPRNEAIDAIRNLARTKGLTTDGMTEAEADATIEKYSGLPLAEENLTKIIISLTSFVAK